jgi:hypothetical protein
MLQRLIWLGVGLAISLIVIAQFSLPAAASHEVIDVNWQGGIYVHGNMFRTTVEIATGNLTEHDSEPSNETRYLVVFRDRIVSEQDLPVQVHNETRAMAPSSNRTVVYSRPLIEGYWLLGVDVYDALTMQKMQVYNSEKTILVQPLVYDLIKQQAELAENQSANAEANFSWTQISLLVGTAGAIGAAFGGAVIGAHYSRKAARQQWETTQHVGNSKDQGPSPEVSRDIASLQERTAISQRDAAESLKKAGELQVLLSLFKMLSDVDLSRAYGRIFVAYCSVYGVDPTETRIKQEQLLRFYSGIKDDVLKIEETFDQIGLVVMKDQVDKKLFLDLYAPTVVQTFRALEVHIRSEQDRNALYAAWYEKLYKAALDYYKNELHSAPPPVHCKNLSR